MYADVGIAVLPQVLLDFGKAKSRANGEPFDQVWLVLFEHCSACGLFCLELDDKKRDYLLFDLAVSVVELDTVAWSGFLGEIGKNVLFAEMLLIFGFPELVVLFKPNIANEDRCIHLTEIVSHCAFFYDVGCLSSLRGFCHFNGSKIKIPVNWVKILRRKFAPQKLSLRVHPMFVLGPYHL